MPNLLPSTRPLLAAAFSLLVLAAAPLQASAAVTFDRTSAWGTGYQANIIVTNTGTQAIATWTLAFTMADRITSSWDATASISGGSVTFTPPSWGASIAPGGSITLGYVATTTAASGWAPPTTATFNGQAVQVQFQGGPAPGPTPPPTPGVVAVALSPASATMAEGGQLAFTATVTGSGDTAVTWTCTGGSISGAGLYTAGAAPGSFRVTATAVADPTKSATAAVSITVPGALVSSGTVGYHLLLGAGTAMDQLVLTGGAYDDLIMSNLVAGVMYGHLLQEYTPGLMLDQDYLYGSLMGQLMQENIETGLYTPGQPLIDPSPLQQAVMAVGQGGPYQINNYAVDMVAGTYAPAGHSLINFVALQDNIGYTMADAATQYARATPPSFNNKYYGPVLTAYFHYNDYVALQLIGTGAGGWVTPWQPAFDEAVAVFKTLPYNFLDMLLNAAYNQGYYGPLLESYSQLGATATAATAAEVRSFSNVWGVADSYDQYPYQVMYYLDQLYDKPIPTTSATTFTTPQNHVAVPMAALGGVFAHVMETLAYQNGAGQYGFISAAQADAAFSAALASAGVASSATLDLAGATSRAQIFTVLEDAIAGLEASLGMKFNATTSTQL